MTSSDFKDLKALYQEVILDHNKRPRNFRKLAAADHHAEGYNPLCGDHVNVYLQVQGDIIHDVTFEGTGCAISKASASIMTETVKGKTLGDVEVLFEKFHQMVTGRGDPRDRPRAGANTRFAPTEDLGKLEVFSGVSEFPARVKCASLAWHTLRSAIQGQKDPITTENEIEEVKKEYGNH